MQRLTKSLLSVTIGYNIIASITATSAIVFWILAESIDASLQPIEPQAAFHFERDAFPWQPTKYMHVPRVTAHAQPLIFDARKQAE